MTTLSNYKTFKVQSLTNTQTVPSAYQNFLQWCDQTENYRFPILAGIVAMQGCVVIPVTLLLSLIYNIGLSDITLLSVSVTTTAVMVSNMALLPMRVVLITFGLNLLINFTLIALYLPSLFK